MKNKQLFVERLFLDPDQAHGTIQNMKHVRITPGYLRVLSFFRALPLA